MDHNKHGIKRSGGRAFLFVLFFIFALPSCSILSPRIQERVITLRDTVEVHSRDSVFFRDSVYVREWVKGDTVFVTKFKDRYVYRDRWRDSVRVAEVHDTTTVAVEVEKSLSWDQKAKIDLFPWLTGAVIALLIWVTRKWWLRIG